MERLPYFDTHAHLDTEDFDADREALLQEIGSHMLGFINPGCDVRSSKASLAMAHRYDYVYAAPHERQQTFLIRQLAMARELKLPVIIHDREAHEDMTRLLLTEGQGVRGVLHCFSGDWAMAETFIKAGWYFGFGGTSTFKNDHGVREILRKMPLDRIVFETDSPYMAPVPYRGKRNNPLYVKLVAEMAAEVKGIPVLSMMEIATKNSQNLFPKLKSY